MFHGISSKLRISLSRYTGYFCSQDQWKTSAGAELVHLFSKISQNANELK